MKPDKLIILITTLVLFMSFSSSIAAPLGLGSFSDPFGTGQVTVGTDSIFFTESMDYGALYAADDIWIVPDDAASLSFDYDLSLGPLDFGDYLTLEIDFASAAVLTDPTGSFSFDLTSYIGQTISVAWGLIWNWDMDAGTTASIYNIEVTTANDGGGITPIPEPGTFLLLGASLIGLIWLKRKK